MELRVVAALEVKGYESFTPTYLKRRAWSDRIKVSKAPLFPGYVFFRPIQDNTGLVVSTIGVRRIVAFGSVPCPLREQEVQALQKIIQSKVEARPYAFIREGEKVRVEDGPLLGVEGTVLRIKKSRRLVVSIEILMRSIAVDIEGYNIVSVEDPCLRIAA